MDLFSAVKDSVTVRDVAERFGIPVNRAGMARCVFHRDHTPSMKVDKRFHCFGCGADGDVIDFTARLFGLTLREAAERLAASLNEAYDAPQRAKRTHSRPLPVARRSLLQKMKNYQNENYRVLCNYLRLLRDWEREYAPKREDEDWHPLYIEAIQNYDRVLNLIDELQFCSESEAAVILSKHKNEVARCASRVREFMPRPNRSVQEFSK